MRWVEPEKQVRVELRPALRDYVNVARNAHRFVAAAIGTAMYGRSGPVPHHSEVQARLLVKISNDLRVVELSAKRSYVLQALGLAATIYECAHAVAFIGTSDERAKRWEEHDSSQRSYPSAADRKKAVRATLLAMVPDLSNVEAAVAQQEQHYQVFCMAKHGNPKALRRFGVAVRGNRVQLYHGPFAAKYIIRQARFALFHTAWLVTGAAAVFASPLLEGAPVDVRRRYYRLDRLLGEQISSLMARVHDDHYVT